MTEHRGWVNEGLCQAHCDCGWQAEVSDSWGEAADEMAAHAATHTASKDGET